MNTKRIAIRDCIKCKRGKNSICGNPKYIFTFDDNTTVKTEANAGWVFGLNSCQSYENKRITFFLFKKPLLISLTRSLKLFIFNLLFVLSIFFTFLINNKIFF